MSLSLACILLIAALITCIFSATGRAPLWVSVLLAILAGLLTCLPAH